MADKSMAVTRTPRIRVSTRLHGILDYVFGVSLVLIALGLGLAGQAAGVTLIFIGIAIVSVAIVTDFELGLFPRIQMPVHLWADGVLGLLLAFSPWLFVFYDTTWAIHLSLGLVLVIIAFFTQTVPGYERRSGPPSA